jgi:hypothetical protein
MFEIDAPKATAVGVRVVPRDEEVAPMAPALSADLPSTLHYAPSPIQRRSAVNGISPGENEAVRRLSGGRVDLHGIGASLQRVPADDARLAAVHARSYAQGRQALVSEAADRGHELWHLAQQAMGRVRPTMQVQGRSVNADTSLEQEADRLGALIDRHSPSMPSGPADTASSATNLQVAPIQRKVTEFAVDTEDYLPPVPDLIDEIKHDYFKGTEKEINAKIRALMIDPKTSLTEVPTSIEATIEKIEDTDTKPARKTHMTSVVGKIGADEFSIRSRPGPENREIFEGGHLIPHELWSTTDPHVAEADGYANLVPMSRTMNVSKRYESGWRVVEKDIINKVEKLKGSATLRVGIEIDHQSYDISYQDIATFFGLTLETGKVGTDRIDLNSWFPVDITASTNPGTSKEKEIGRAFENPLHDLWTPITTKTQFITALQGTPLWSRMNGAIQDKILKL